MSGMQMFEIVISTIARKQNQYIWQTLESLHASSNRRIQELNLFVGNPDTQYLDENNLNLETYKIHKVSEQDWTVVKDKGQCIKFNFNFCRCLNLSLKEESIGLLYLEDDIIFHQDWDLSLSSLINSLKQEHQSFALSIYTAYNLTSFSTDLVNFKKGFYGTQGVFFTKDICRDFAQYVWKKGIEEYNHMADLLLQIYCNEKNIPLIVLKKPLIQHIGVESTITKNNFHQAVSF